MTARHARSASPGANLGRRLGRTRWLLVIVGYLLAIGAGWAYGMVLKARGEWEGGAPWERSLLAAVEAATPQWFQSILYLVPWVGTNFTLGPLVALIAIWLLRHRRRDLATWLVTVELGVLSLNWLVKQLLGRNRPEIIERVGWYGWESYPSGHSMASLAVLTTFALMIHRANGATWPFWASGVVFLLVSYSRLLHGVHWPSDMVGGALVGVVWLVTTWLAFVKLPTSDASHRA